MLSQKDYDNRVGRYCCEDGVYAIFSAYMEKYDVGSIVPDIWSSEDYTKHFNPTNMFKFGIEYGLLLASAVIYEGLEEVKD